ncbi:uncharacterized protein LOC116289272 [Actinia tenebrosa]|uniref:Uncharacterized protein LOC116289272 n=1 Tax=Actinia tenebrosa TaxID=6105 RepID=A0A6P8HHI0_ACTTE|nr:uncharacterized protein LOC116289272 [Actinia tenebrosa]
MAASSSASQERVAFFRKRLEDLDCPYIDGVDDSWIEELLYKPGEPRLRLIQWLLGRFDPTVHDVLEGQQSKAKEDARLQRLLFVCNLLGLCKPDDIELVKGSTSKGRQIVFMENMIDLVGTVDSMDTYSRTKGISVAESISDQFARDCQYLDTLCRQEDLSEIFKTRIQLSPPDLAKGGSRSDDKRVPDNKQLANVADQLATELETQNLQLDNLRNKVCVNEADPQTKEKVSKTLNLALTTMSQVVTGFLYCYESEMKPWSNRSQPNLSELGPAFERVYSLLEKFLHLLEGFSSIKSSHTSMCDKTKTQLQNTKDGSLAPMSKDTLENLQDCVTVLEESIQRYQEQQR